MTTQELIRKLRRGARLKSTEGPDYRAWVETRGREEPVRRDVAERACREIEDELVFGEPAGVRHKKFTEK